MYAFTGKMLLRQMLQQAKDEDLTINVRHAKILFCGAAKAGKSSFCRLLTSKKHNTIYESTEGADTQQVLISEKKDPFDTKVNVRGTDWISLDSKLQIKQIVSRLVQKLQNKKGTVKDNFINVDVSAKSDDPSFGNVKNAQMSDQTVPRTIDTSSENAHFSVPQENTSENKSPIPKSNSKHSAASDTKIESSDDDIQTTEFTNIEGQMLNVSVSELENTRDTWDLFTLLDTGGQPEFINMLPAINNLTAITFVVLDISNGKDSLKSKVIAQMQLKGYVYEGPDLQYTNMDLLKCLLSSIKVSAIKKDYFDSEIVKMVTEDEPQCKPVVCIIGTWFDVLKKRFGEKYNEQLLEIDEEVNKLVDLVKEDKKLVFWCRSAKNYVFPISNKISREQLKDDFERNIAEEIKRICDHSNEILKKKAQYEIPITWFILELQLRNSDNICIPLSEVETICDGIIPPDRKMDKEKIIQVLKFFHLHGMLLYFSEVDGMKEFVITNPKWLFTNLSKIIMCKYRIDAKDLYEAHHIEDIQKGICSMELLEKLELDLQKIKLESFLELLEHLKIIVPVDKSVYFIPNMLPLCNENDIFTEKECGKPVAYTHDGKCIHPKVPEVEALAIEFTFGTIPRGLFGSLIVHLLKNNPDTYKLCDHICQYSDLISFFIKRHCLVSLHDRISYLELQVRVYGEEPSYHYIVQTAVTKALKEVCKDFNWQYSDCRYGFICHLPEHSQDKHLTVLSEKQPIPDVIPKVGYCKNQPWKTISFTKAHTIWFEVCDTYT